MKKGVYLSEGVGLLWLRPHTCSPWGGEGRRGWGGGEESVHSFHRHSPTRRVNTAGSRVAGVIELSLSASDCVSFNLPFPSLTATVVLPVTYSILIIIRACICKPFRESRNRFPAWRNRFLGIDSWAP
jgi:hypothetical protein